MSFATAVKARGELTRYTASIKTRNNEGLAGVVWEKDCTSMTLESVKTPAI